MQGPERCKRGIPGPPVISSLLRGGSALACMVSRYWFPGARPGPGRITRISIHNTMVVVPVRCPIWITGLHSFGIPCMEHFNNHVWSVHPRTVERFVLSH